MNKKKIVFVGAVIALVVVLTSVTAFASTTPTDMEDIMKTAFEAAVASILRSLGVILPIFLGLFGTLIAIKFAIRFFGSVTSKGASGN